MIPHVKEVFCMCRLLYDQSSLRNRWEILGGPQQSAFLSRASAGWLGPSRSICAYSSGLPHRCIPWVPGKQCSRCWSDALHIMVAVTQDRGRTPASVGNWHVLTLPPFIWPKQVPCPRPVSAGRGGKFYSRQLMVVSSHMSKDMKN